MIENKDFKRAIQYIEIFHFAYNSLMKNSTNKLEKIYAKFAQDLRKSTNKVESRKIIDDLINNKLKVLMPEKTAFTNSFIKLTNSKQDSTQNMKTKYAINKLHCYKNRLEYFDDRGTIEHIRPEHLGGESYNIGNLILLEGEINEKCQNKDFNEKIELYKKSDFEWVKQFIVDKTVWEKEDIQERATKMASEFFDFIISR